MPKIAKHKLLTFFLSTDAPLNEPPHLYLVKEKGGIQKSAKIWLNTLEVEDNGSQSKTDLKLALKLIKNQQELLLETFKKVKKGEEITPIKLKIK